ncbi:hypothetical protein BDY24DRAFT_415838 [Mrakia frigida]|uniref:uncharacterized protein n=1 Tax=Mrakia frigida TaxID=29902 RepID=UPI003FCC0EC9
MLVFGRICPQEPLPRLPWILKPAGPVLYEDVEIRTLQQLYSFFFTMSSISETPPPSSQPRRDFVLPSVSHASGTSAFGSTLLPMNSSIPSSLSPLGTSHIVASNRTQSSVFLALLHRPSCSPSPQPHGERDTPTNSTQSLDLHLLIPIHSGLLATRFTKLKPAAAFLELVGRLDLRLVLVEQDWKDGVEATTRVMMEHEEFWSSATLLEMEVLVKDDEVGKVVEDVVEGLSSERRSRCRVARS